MIAARVQEEAFGTLDRATLNLLDGLARRGGSRPAERNLKIGTVLVRDYQGRGLSNTWIPISSYAVVRRSKWTDHNA